MKNTHYLKTTINFNNREIDIELRGIYTPYRNATYIDPPEGDEMELTEIVTKVFFNPELNGQYREIDIIDTFTQDELLEFNNQLYANGEKIE